MPNEPKCVKYKYAINTNSPHNEIEVTGKNSIFPNKISIIINIEADINSADKNLINLSKLTKVNITIPIGPGATDLTSYASSIQYYIKSPNQESAWSIIRELDTGRLVIMPNLQAKYLAKETQLSIVLTDIEVNTEANINAENNTCNIIIEEYYKNENNKLEKAKMDFAIKKISTQESNHVSINSFDANSLFNDDVELSWKTTGALYCRIQYSLDGINYKYWRSYLPVNVNNFNIYTNQSIRKYRLIAYGKEDETYADSNLIGYNDSQRTLDFDNNSVIFAACSSAQSIFTIPASLNIFSRGGVLLQSPIRINEYKKTLGSFVKTKIIEVNKIHYKTQYQISGTMTPVNCVISSDGNWLYVLVSYNYMLLISMASRVCIFSQIDHYSHCPAFYRAGSVYGYSMIKPEHLSPITTDGRFIFYSIQNHDNTNELEDPAIRKIFYHLIIIDTLDIINSSNNVNNTIRAIQLDVPIKNLVIPTDGKYLYGIEDNKKVVSIDTKTFKKIMTEYDGGNISSSGLSVDGKYFCAVDMGQKRVVGFDTKTNERIIYLDLVEYKNDLRGIPLFDHYMGFINKTGIRNNFIIRMVNAKTNAEIKEIELNIEEDVKLSDLKITVEMQHKLIYISIFYNQKMKIIEIFPTNYLIKQKNTILQLTNDNKLILVNNNIDNSMDLKSRWQIKEGFLDGKEYCTFFNIGQEKLLNKDFIEIAESDTNEKSTRWQKQSHGFGLFKIINTSLEKGREKRKALTSDDNNSHVCLTENVESNFAENFWEIIDRPLPN